MQEFLVPCRGTNFRDREEKDHLLTLIADTPVVLEREPDNQYDENAIKILHDQHHLGFVGKEFAAAIAPLMDAGMTFDAVIDHFTGPLAASILITERIGDESA